MSDAPFIQAKEIVRNYGTLPVLRGINLSIQKGEIVAVVGTVIVNTDLRYTRVSEFASTDLNLF